MNSKKIILSLFSFSLAILIGLQSCKKNKDEEPSPESTFDKSGMLTNIADNIIVPQYEQVKNKIDSLKISTTDFTSNPTLSNLNLLQNKFIDAYKAYQWISTFEFGPAETEILRSNFNTFPCDTVQVKNNINSGTYDLSMVSNIPAKGFPALDFLLFGVTQNNNYVLSIYTSATTATYAKNYLNDIVNELQIKTNTVYNSWISTGGNYASIFKSNTGSDVGGSIGMLVNQLNYDFEILKNAKVGIPLGKMTLGIPLPEKVEAFYNQQSLELIQEHIQSIENIYLGRSQQNIDGLGLDDYLTHIDARYGSISLNDAIKNKLISAKAKIAAIPGPLSQAVVTNATIVDQAYAELQQLVILLKVDMPSALGVLITYQDNDGD